MTDLHSQRILILDFGSQYTQLIARRVREAGVYCELHAWDMGADAIREFAPRGIILSGGPESVTEQETPRASDIVFELGVPVLGICYGMQTMATQLGGKVDMSAAREYGYAQVQPHKSILLNDLHDRLDDEGHAFLDVWMSHGDKVTELPDGFSAIAHTDNAPLAGIADEERAFFGLQFHPEVTHTRLGQDILRRFVHDICDCKSLWTPGNIIEDLIRSAREQVEIGRAHV